MSRLPWEELWQDPPTGVPRQASTGFRARLRHAAPAAAGGLAMFLAVQLFWYERDIATNALDWPSIAFAAAFVLCLASLFALLSRRLYASVALACGLLVLTTIVSVVKYSHMRASLYALDLYNYASLSDLNAFYTKFFSAMVVGLLVIAFTVAVAWWLFAIDATRIDRRRSAAILGLAALTLVASYSWRGYRGKIYHYFPGHHVTALLASVPEAVTLGGHLEAANRGGAIDSAPAPGLQNAVPGQRPPTLITILHESSFPADLFPIQCGGRVPKALYTSGNGHRYDLNTETYNGSTWMTEYGLNLGLSTYYLGDNRIWFGHVMENKIHDSLALQLRRHGYRSIAVYPSERTFLNSAPFYRSIGFDAFLDIDDQHAPTEFERDRFYYATVIEQIRAHKASGATSPLYLATWINATHSPFLFARHPDVPPDPATICARSGEWAEYIRRQLMSEDDIAWLTERLKAEFPGEPFLILGFGDHHPHLSRAFLPPNASNPFTPLRGSIGYKTFFRVTGIGFEPDWSVIPESIDTPFLGNVLMLAARLPRSGFYNDRDKLMALCRGRYADCPHQDEILSFHQRLIDAGAIENR